MSAVARAMGRALAGAWRADEPAVELTADELAAMSPHLALSGELPLVWARIRGTALADTPAGVAAHRAALAHAAAAVTHEEQLRRLCDGLRAAGVEPVLAKGRALARLYADPLARPAADIDLYVRPADAARAEAALAVPELAAIGADLHAGVPDLEEDDAEAVLARAVPAAIGATTVRVLAREDHLRLVVLHMLRHAAWRPLWLCDVGALVEAPGELDWDRVLAGSARLSSWVAGGIALACSLVEARVCEPRVTSGSLPRWLEPAVLAHWTGGGRHLYDGVPLVAWLARPSGLRDALARRWPSPLQATISRRAAFDERPRWPLQLADWAERAVRSAARLPSTLLEMARSS